MHQAIQNAEINYFTGEFARNKSNTKELSGLLIKLFAIGNFPPLPEYNSLSALVDVFSNFCG